MCTITTIRKNNHDTITNKIKKDALKCNDTILRHLNHFAIIPE